MSEKLNDARYYVKENKVKNRLNYHITPSVGWLNDPNGLVYFRDEYHVFYQTYPYDTKNSNIYWGHVKSKDLVGWEECPLALAPDKDYDINGCFTGSAIVHDDELVLMYTGHRLTEDAYIETQNIARSIDGINFTKYEGNPVIEKSPEDTTHRFRDPKIWSEDNKFYTVIGGEDFKNNGKVIIYETEDLANFKYKGVLASSDGDLGEVWECPNFINIDDKDILIISPKGLKDRKKFNYPYESGYLIGNYDREKNNFNHSKYNKLDFGHDFYAPQVFKDRKGRSILIGWFGVPEAKLEEIRFGWANALTLPRELYLNKDNRLCMKPVEESVALREEKIVDTKLNIEEENSFNIDNDSAEFLLDIINIEECTESVGFNIKSNNNFVQILYYPKKNEVILSRNTEDGIRKATIYNSEKISMRIYLDKSTIEVFIGNGEAVFSSRVYFDGKLNFNLVCNDGRANARFKYFKLRKIF